MPDKSERRFALTGPLSLVLFKGHLGFWSRDEAAKKHCIWLDQGQAAVLLQLATGPQCPAQAAAAAGVEYDSGVDELIADLVRHRIVSEQVDTCDAPFYRFYHPDIDESVPICIVEPEALDEATVRSIVDGLHDSGLVGDNVLAEAFTGTRGFGVKFRRDALARVINWLPWTRAYFDRILDETVWQRFELSRSDHSRPNAFYFNALLIPAGVGTGLHIDRTLDGRTAASWVSVLYLETVPPPGGRLFLYDGSWPVGLVNPRPGMLVHFRGSLRHGVSNTDPAGRQRSSLVCEHYALEEATLQHCPHFELVAIN